MKQLKRRQKKKTRLENRLQQTKHLQVSTKLINIELELMEWIVNDSEELDVEKIF